MKKRILMILLLILLPITIMACSNDDDESQNNENDANETNDSEEANDNNAENGNDSENAESGTENEELVKAAQEEGEVVVYSSTSRIHDAADKFEEKYGIKVEASNLDGTDLITKVSTEAQSDNIKPDFVLAQESGRVQAELIETGFLESKVPESLKDVIPENAQEPLDMIYVNRVFTYNSETYTFPPVANIWELTEPEWEGEVLMTDPDQDGVNMEFLTMLTNPEWSEKIAEAYKLHYGEEIELTTENAGYEWIKAWLDNGVVRAKGDTVMSENVGAKGHDIKKIGLHTYSKLRDAEEKDLALMPIMSMQPFAGFYYPTMLLTNAEPDHPNAAELFQEFLLTEEGYEPWMTFGNYSPNPNIPTVAGDTSFEVWERVLVEMDPEYIMNNRGELVKFLNSEVSF